ncbi:hypothetical protein HDU89_006730 [Geranomyces variabilis]|nr:hypothetical protein HDU89_006730 [Geranomyces variabilis]
MQETNFSPIDLTQFCLRDIAILPSKTSRASIDYIHEVIKAVANEAKDKRPSKLKLVKLKSNVKRLKTYDVDDILNSEVWNLVPKSKDSTDI